MNFANVKSMTIPVGGVARDVKAVSIGGVTVWTKPNPLPYDALVQYVESDGTQYVDTGLSIASGAFEMGVDFDASYAENNCAIAVQGDATSGTTQQKRLAFYHNAANTNYIIDRGTAGSRINQSGDSVDTGKLTFAIVLNSAKRILVCRSNGINGLPNLRGRIRYFRLWDSADTLVRDLVPVRVGSGANAVGYLYDRTNPTGGPSGNGLYGSATSTPLVAGPDRTP